MVENEIRQKPEIPEKLKILYASWSEDDEKIYESVLNGLDTIIWFSMDMSINKIQNKSEFTRGPDYKEVGKIIKKIKDNKYDLINLISFGGWNSKHVNTNFIAEEYYEYEEWINFNKK